MRASCIVKLSRRSLSHNNSITSVKSSIAPLQRTPEEGCTTAGATPLHQEVRTRTSKPSLRCSTARFLSSSAQQDIEDNVKTPPRASTNSSSSISSASSASTVPHVPAASATPRKVVGVSKEDEHTEETKRRRLSEVRLLFPHHMKEIQNHRYFCF
jgi:hypothetical protein